MHRVGILGGTFNPVHVGHLRLALEAKEAVGLDLVELVPAPRPPHKREAWMLPFKLRLELLRLGLAGLDGLAVNDVEARREGPSYTCDTLEALGREHPDQELFFIMGASDLLNLHLWKRGMELGCLANLVVATRDRLGQAEVAAYLREHGEMGYEPDSQDAWRRSGGRSLVLVPIPRLDISASFIRERFRRGADLRFLLPPAVEEALKARRPRILEFWAKESFLAGEHTA
jgi:nicotinate-nucleotide adenylyltransferase